MASDGHPGNWKDVIDPTLPCWVDHLDLIARLGDNDFPDCAELGKLLPPGLRHPGRPPIRFVSSDRHAPGPYEQRIFETGQVSTRPNNWHDLFNALTWALLPQTKLAINALHCAAGSGSSTSGRGRRRDALTLFDECGVILACSSRDWLERLARHRWDECLRGQGDFLREHVTLVVAGHALLEKFLAPYPAMTGNALLLHIDPNVQTLARPERLAWLDRRLSANLRRGSILRRPTELSPLPMMGIPGGWPGLRQDSAFYSDRSVFRPLRDGRQPAPIHRLA